MKSNDCETPDGKKYFLVAFRIRSTPNGNLYLLEFVGRCSSYFLIAITSQLTIIIRGAAQLRCAFAHSLARDLRMYLHWEQLFFFVYVSPKP